MCLRSVVALSIALVCFCAGRQDVSVGKQPKISPSIQYSGGSGDSYEEAVKITGATKQSEGVDAEYKYLSDKYGAKGRDWNIAGQTNFREKGKVYDIIEVRLSTGGDNRIYYFDVTGFQSKQN
jgi:hypothetical protein